MQKRYVVLIGVSTFVLALALVFLFQEPEVEIVVVDEDLEEQGEAEMDESGVIDYSRYNHQFAEGSVVNILSSRIGDEGTVYFYLPPTKYINVSSGDSYGVAFALNNPNPSGENYFEYEFNADSTAFQTCGVDAKTADSWIAMGHKSFGKIPKGWIDMMTVYFEFPDNLEDCNAKYNFAITKDGVSYGSEVIEFNIG